MILFNNAHAELNKRKKYIVANGMFFWGVFITEMSPKMEGMAVMSKPTFPIKLKIRNQIQETNACVIIYLQ